MDDSTRLNSAAGVGSKHDNVVGARVYEGSEIHYEGTKEQEREMKLVRKIDWRLCTIAGVLCSLNLLVSRFLVREILDTYEC